MCYVDAIYDRQRDEIKVVERQDGKRVFKTIPPEHVFYYTHPAGSYRTIFDDPVKKYSSSNWKKFSRELRLIESQVDRNGQPKYRIFESDIKPVFRALADHYLGQEAPVLNVGFVDIEAAYDPVRRWASPDDPFNAVTAISLYLSQHGRCITLALKPETYSTEDAEAIVEKFQDTILFENEREMLLAFLDLIDDADVLTGWNSSSYDIPYLVNRIERLLSKADTRAFCLWGELPRLREYMNAFGKMVKTYDLVGRVHLDYLELYRKHNTQQRLSYRLDYIGEIEVNENKVPYEGTLDDLYKRDFEKFIAYNRQDVLLMVKIDAKLKFIELANQIAHANGVVLQTTMGSVALVEQAIINEMHAEGRIVPNRKKKIEETPDEEYDEDAEDEEDERNPVVGAYVAKPKVGIHEMVACVDINSLYPSAIRALNMSPETLFGQIRPDETTAHVAERVAKLSKTQRAESWDGLFCTLEVSHVMARDGAPLTVDFSDGSQRVFSGRALYDFIFDPKNNLCLTANGTIFRTDKIGLIPKLLAKWYAQRKEMQAISKAFDAIYEGTGRPEGWKKDALLQPWLDDGTIRAEGDWYVPTSDENKAKCKSLYGLYDQRQQARKILLNSLYGALLNEGLRFYDERVGQSVTLTGRSIVRHMNAKANEAITGQYDFTGEAIVYADTDSCYFSAAPILRNDPAYSWFDHSPEAYIELYDSIADEINKSFPEFMHRTFNTGLERGGIIQAGRELVASKALFIKKKKYACLMIDKEGKRLDVGGKPGKLKVMGLDLKRADTPKYMQEFLETVLTDVLVGSTRDEIFDSIRLFRRSFKKRPGWDKGSPKKVAGMTDYAARKKRMVESGLFGRRKANDKKMIPGHVTASMNWNRLCDVYDDAFSMRIGDGMRIVVCKLKKNHLNMDSIAYPIDEPHLPKWFKDLPFDHDAMEDAIIDKKLNNLLGVLKWNLNLTKIQAGGIFTVGSKSLS